MILNLILRLSQMSTRFSHPEIDVKWRNNNSLWSLFNLLFLVMKIIQFRAQRIHLVLAIVVEFSI